MMTFPTALTHDNFAIKLESCLHSGDLSHGTGFIVLHNDRHWLITCRHLIESEVLNLTGVNEAIWLRGLSPASNKILLDGRSVITPRINGTIADAVAIEIDEATFRDTPKFVGDATLPISGNYTPRDKLTISGNGHSVSFPMIGNFWVQGFPNLDADIPPVTIETAYAQGMPTIHPWMIAYTPKAANGFSGGPVIKLGQNGATLWGIHTHSYDAEITGTMSDGNNFAIGLGFGGAVPLKPLLQAIVMSQTVGEEVIDVHC